MSAGKDKRYPEVAVALRYDGKDAPRVTAQGEGALAEAICRVAAEHGVPLYEDAALANILSKVELGEEIPETLYRAVAEVIAFAYLLSDRICGVCAAPQHEPPSLPWIETGAAGPSPGDDPAVEE